MPNARYPDQQTMDAFTQAYQQANAGTGSATVGFRNGDSDGTETGYDVTVTRFDGGLPAAQALAEGVLLLSPPQRPTPGSIVLYAISEGDAAAINKRYAHHAAFKRTIVGTPDPGMPGATGHVAHIGNYASAGDYVPAVIVRVFNETTMTANLQVLLDGADTYWATSRAEGDTPGTWTWLPRA